MKKILIFLFVSIFEFVAFGQSKTDDTDLDAAKRLFVSLKSIEVNTKQELQWEYTYSDTLKTTLDILSKALEKEGLKAQEISLSKKVAHSYNLIVSEIKQYKTPELLGERAKYLNTFAHNLKIKEPNAKLGASKVK